MGNSNLATAPGTGKNKVSESDLSKLDNGMSNTPGSKIEDSGYKTKINIPKSNSPEINDLSTMNLADAPEKGAKVPTKNKTNPNLASAPGKVEGDSGYEAFEYPSHTGGKKEINDLDNMNLSDAPSEGAEGKVSYKLDAETGYNIGEGETSTIDLLTLKGIKEYIIENKDSEEVQRMIQDLVNEGFERPSPELKKN
jgi:hypothetical protein